MSDAKSNLIIYSVKAKAHDLTLLKLRAQNLNEVSYKGLVDKYLEGYSKIYDLLENDRLEKLKRK